MFDECRIITDHFTNLHSPATGLKKEIAKAT
jgi:hypothetical protein